MGKAIRLIIFLGLTIVPSTLLAQVAEQNVNMVSGTEWPGGDPFLQRQNEPSIAMSTRNPLHLFAGANDYRTVDLPGLPDGEETGDAWLGMFKSFDGGQTWRSSLIAGYPQDQTSAGLASPLKGFQAAADPVVRAGNNGLFYFAGIVLNRDPNNPLGGVFVARFIDNNNLEAGDPVAHLGTVMVDHGTSGQFLDKPWVAVGPSDAGATPCTINGQTIPAQNVYLAYTIFTPNDPNLRSKLMLARSGDCGASWTLAKLSESYAVNQGATVAVDRATGAVYVAWRRFSTSTDPNSILMAKSTDFGKSFSKGSVVATIDPFEQNTTGVSIRTNAYPALASDAAGRVYLAWSQRGVGPGGDARIVMMNSPDGAVWSPPTQVDPSALRGHQFMPSMAMSQSKLLVAFYDLREDHTIGIYTPIFGTGRYNESRQRTAEDPEQDKVFTPYLMDVAPAGFTRLLRRHTIDLRAAEATAGVMPTFVSARVSRYVFGSRPGTGTRTIEQMQYNPPNFPMFRLGTVPFFGDYIDVVGYGGPNNAPVFHAVWTDNRDVRPPADGNWANYTPPRSLSTTLMSRIDPTRTVPQCVAGQTSMRNQNIYTARITNGLFAGSPGNSKPLGKIQRPFVVFVQNANNDARTFRLTLAQQPPGGTASFDQFALQTQIDVPVPARSSATRTVFVASTDPHASVPVGVAEISGGVASGIGTTVVLNPDISNPDISNPDISNPDISNPDISNAEVHNPDISNPDISNPDISNPDISNPDISNPDISNPDISNPDISNPDISNPDISNPDISNPDISNPDISNPDISNGSVSDTTWTVRNQGNTTSGYAVKLVSSTPVPSGAKMQLIVNRIYQTPVARPNCVLGVELHRQVVTNIVNPQFTSFGQLTTSNAADATLSLAPSDAARITLRVFNSVSASFDPATAVIPVVIAQAVNTTDATRGIAQPPMTLTVTTTSLPDGVAGRLYSATVTATGGVGAYIWSMSGAPGLSISSSGVISGTIATGGDAFATVTVRDSASTSHTATRTIRIRIAEPLLVTSSTLPEGTLGQAYGPAALTASGGTGGRTWQLESGTLPSGLTLSSAGTISGTPMAAADSSFTVRITDSGSPAQSASQQLMIRVIEALVIQTASLPEATATNPYSATLVTTGGFGARSWTVTAGSLPSGLMLSANGVISGTPAVAGAYAVTFTVTDSDWPANTRSATLLLTVRSPVAIVTAALPIATAGIAFTVTMQATGGMAPYTWTSSGPAGSTITSTTGVFSGTAQTPGTYSVLFTVTDVQGRTATKTLDLIVVAPLTITTSAIPDGTVAQPYPPFALEASGGFGAKTWSVQAGVMPSGLILNSATGVISGTPTAVADSAITVAVTDSAAPQNIATQTFIFRVHPPVGTMVIRPTTAAAGFGQVVAIDGSNFPVPTMITVSFSDPTRTANGTLIEAACTSTMLYVRLPFVGDGQTRTNLVAGPLTFNVSSSRTSLGSGHLTLSSKPGTPLVIAMFSLTTAPSTDNRCGSGISQSPVQTIAFGRGVVVSAFGVDTTGAEFMFTQANVAPIVQSSCAYTNTTLGVAPVFGVPSGLQSGAVVVQMRTTVNAQASDWSAPITLTLR